MILAHLKRRHLLYNKFYVTFYLHSNFFTFEKNKTYINEKNKSLLQINRVHPTEKCFWKHAA